MEEVPVQELRLDQMHEGRVLAGTLDGDVEILMGRYVVTALIDSHGDMVTVVVDKVAFPGIAAEQLRMMYPSGAQVRIKEPLYVSDVPGIPFAVFVFNPARVEFVSYLPKGFPYGEEDLKKMGNAEYQRQNYLGAAEIYTRCIVQGGENTHLLYSNRAECYLKLQRLEDALADCNKALEIEPEHMKSWYRKARALSELRDYVQAARCFERACELVDDCPELVSLCHESQRLARESTDGTHDLRYDHSPQKLADYIGPVEIRKSTNKLGRGLFLTRDVKLGDLLFVCNPLVIEHDMIRNALVPRLVMACTNSRRTLLHVRNLVYTTCDPHIDLFKPNQGVMNDVKEEITEEDVIGIERAALGMTGFGESAYWDGYGLWTIPALMFHSCLPNVRNNRVGDALCCVAACDMKAGCELLRSYCPVMHPRALSFENGDWWCSCERCTLEKRLFNKLKVCNDKILFTTRMTEAIPQAYFSTVTAVVNLIESMDVSEREKQLLRVSYGMHYTLCMLMCSKSVIPVGVLLEALDMAAGFVERRHAEFLFDHARSASEKKAVARFFVKNSLAYAGNKHLSSFLSSLSEQIRRQVVEALVDMGLTVT